jgi:hypothetical protein
VTAGGLPKVDEATAAADRQWLAEHPRRRFRARNSRDGYWIVRKGTGGALLRTLSRLSEPSGDADLELAALWFASAWPEMPVEEVQRRAREACKEPKGGSHL